MPMQEKETAVKRAAAGRKSGRRGGRRRMPRARKVLAVCASLALVAAALQLTASLALGTEGGGFSLPEGTAAGTSGVGTAGTQATDTSTDTAAGDEAAHAEAAQADAAAEAAAQNQAAEAATQQADEAAQSGETFVEVDDPVALAPVTVDDPVCKVVDTNGVNTFASIADAVTYIGAVSTSSFATQFASSGGTATIEMLKGETLITATTAIATGASRPIKITTASATAGDGYPYEGDASAEGGRAVIKFGASSIGAFKISGSSNVTLENCVIDGNKSAGYVALGDDNGAVYMNSSTFTMNSGAEIRNVNAASGVGGSAVTLLNGSVLNMNSGSAIKDCEGTNHGAVRVSTSANGLAAASEVTIDGGTISGCSGMYGGAMYFLKGTVTLKGNTQILNNTGTNASGAIFFYEGNYGNKVLNIEGTTTIMGNTSLSSEFNSCGAISGSNVASSKIYVSGCPYIYRNWNSAGQEYNMQDFSDTSAGSIITVGEAGLERGAKIGIYSTNYYTTGAIFAKTAAASASTVSGLGAFFNDRNASLVGVAGTGSTVVWTEAVVKETTTAGEVKYYGSLDEAITGATDGSTLEILRSHALTGDATTGTKNLTIQNIVTPATKAEDPLENGSANDENGEPIVYFTTGTATDGRITIGSGTEATVTIKGVHFSGKYLDGTTVGARSRTTSGIEVSANATLNISDGDTAGTYIDGSAHAPASTVIEDFVNTSTTNAAAGGFALVNGILTIDSGTITGCKCAGASWKGGGAVAFQNAGSTVNLNGGLVTANGQSDGNGYLCGPFALIGGEFNMSGGTISKNTSRVGGAIGHANAGEDTAVSAATINISGGNILENTAADYDGGALQISSTTTCTISGGIIAKNHAKRSAGAINMRPGCTLTISGHPIITGNTCSATSVYGAAISTIGSYGDTPIAISGNPVIYDNTNGNNAQANINLGSNANLKVGVMEKGAVVGYTSATASLVASGGQFGTSTQSAATSSGYLAGFYNDVTKSAAGLALRGSAGDATAVVWATIDPNVKLTEVATASVSDGTSSEYTVVHTFATIAEAVECAGVLPADNMPTYAEGAGVDGDITEYYKMEVLVGELTQTAVVGIAVGADKPLMLTTASSTATDGYPYRGDTSKESGRAVVKIGATGIGAFEISGSSNLTLGNCIIDGNKSAGYVIPTNTGAVKSTSSTFVMNSGGEIRNAKQGDTNGGIAVQLVGGNFKMRDGSYIRYCENTHNGAVYVNSAAVATIDGGVISDCTGTYGAAMYIAAGTVTLKGATQILNNTATCGGAIFVNESSAGSVTKILNIEGSTKVKGNISKEAKYGAYGAIAVPNAASTRVYVSGSPYVYDNWNAAGEAGGVQYNLEDPTGLNDGTVISVAEEGLEDDAKIGVYAATNYKAGNTFARTVTTKSTDYENLSAFVNDKNTRLTGLASAADPYNRVIWSSAEKLVLTKVLPAATAHDTWFTVQLKDTASGTVYRQAIKVPAGSTSGSATVLVQSGVAYEVSDAAEQSSWRYTADTTAATRSDSPAVTPADTWAADATKATLGTLTLACPDTNEYTHTLTMTVKDGAQSWYSDGASVVNSITMS